jgi:hypothetical protein
MEGSHHEKVEFYFAKNELWRKLYEDDSITDLIPVISGHMDVLKKYIYKMQCQTYSTGIGSST